MIGCTTFKSLYALGHAKSKSRSRVTVYAAQSKPTKQSDDKPAPKARLSKIFDLYKNQNLEEQQENLQEYIAEREAIRESRNGRVRGSTAGSRYTNQDPEYLKKREMLFGEDPYTKKPAPIVGGFGEGKPQWWSVWLKAGREKQVADLLQRRVSFLPLVVVNGEEQERTLETWVPEKRVKAWNPKSGKQGNKLVKYDEGGWLLIKTVLDRELSELMKRNVNILGFRDKERFDGYDFPVPCSPETIKMLKEWEADLSDIDEETVRKSLGLAPKKEMDYEDLQAVNAEQFYAAEERRNKKTPRSGLFTSSDTAESSGGWYEGNSRERRDARRASSQQDRPPRDSTRRNTRDNKNDTWTSNTNTGGGWYSKDDDSVDDLSSWFDDAAAAFDAAAVDSSSFIDAAAEEPTPKQQPSDMWGSAVNDTYFTENADTGDVAASDDMWSTPATGGDFSGWLDDVSSPNLGYDAGFNKAGEAFTPPPPSPSSRQQSSNYDNTNRRQSDDRYPPRQDRSNRNTDFSPRRSSYEDRDSRPRERRERQDRQERREYTPRDTYRDTTYNSSFDSSADDLSWWDEAVSDSPSTITTNQGDSNKKKKKQEQPEFTVDASDDDFAGVFDDSDPFQQPSGSRGEYGSRSSAYEPGATVSVKSGPFQDFDGVILGGSNTSGDVVRAELDVFGKPTIVDLNVADIE